MNSLIFRNKPMSKLTYVLYAIFFFVFLIMASKYNYTYLLAIMFARCILIIKIIVFTINNNRRRLGNRNFIRLRYILFNLYLIIAPIFFLRLVMESQYDIKNIMLLVFLDVLSIIQIYLVYKINNIVEYTSKELTYKEELLQSILDSSPNGVVIFDKYGNITKYNESFINIIGNNENRGTIINSKDVNINRLRTKALEIYKGKSFEVEEEIELNEGKIYKCSYCVNYENSECLCILLNISEEKSLFNHLIKLNYEYEQLISNIKSPILISDENHKIINFSKSYEKFHDEIMLYTGRKDLKIKKNKCLLNLIYEGDFRLHKNLDELDRDIVSGEELYNDGMATYGLIGVDGDILWIESKTKTYYEDDKKYIIQSYSNITEYIKRKEYLEETKNMYKALLDSIPEAIYLEDLDTNKYVFINKKFKEIFNLDDNIQVDNLTCRKDLMMVHPEYEYISNEAIMKIKANQSYIFKDIKYLDMNNNIIDAKFASIPFKINNKVLKLTIIKDMKYLKNLENLKSEIIERTKRDSMKMEFFINMSHELKTPLNLIFTSTQLLESLYNKDKFKGSNSKLSNHIKLTKQNSYRLLKIISDLMDFTKMESGFYKLRMENKDIVGLVEDITMSVVSYAKNKGIQIVFDTDIEEMIIAVDVNAIERMVLNLLSNAIKFTPDGGSIYVNITYKDNEIHIEIEDTGIGIKEESINLIFNRFNDVNKDFIGNIHGSGIGLSMVKSMANILDASIKVESQYGQGSKFTISLKNEKLQGEDISNIKTYDYEKTSNVERLVVNIEDIYK